MFILAKRFRNLQTEHLRQWRLIFSESGKWDEKYGTPATYKKAEKYWQQYFKLQQEKAKNRNSDTPCKKGKKYVLAMFPYPSGQLHMGHVRVYTLSDTLSRFYRAQGYRVIHPMGWDAFGLPAENAAIQHKMSPATWTKQNILSMKEQFELLGCCFDWDRELQTCQPEYYRWTQEIFIKMFKAGLVYKKLAVVNWDPVDQTVLANEQVDECGMAWRSGARVEKKLLSQWYIKTTRFSESLLRGLDSPELENWQHVISLQRSWIGRLYGYVVVMPLIENTSRNCKERNEKLGKHWISVFMEFPELLHGVSFIGVRSDHDLMKMGFTDDRLVEIYLNDCVSSSSQNDIVNNQIQSTVTSCDYRVLNVSVKNPVVDRSIPIIVSDKLPYLSPEHEFYIGYGSGSDLDKEICKSSKFTVTDILDGCSLTDFIANTAFTPLLRTQDDLISESEPQNEDSNYINALKMFETHRNVTLTNSGFLNGLKPSLARRNVVEFLQSINAGGYRSNHKLKDWLISRQRYWGTPIPIVECPDCGIIPVPSEELPVELPKVDHLCDSSPLALEHQTDWRRCCCPKCGGPALRESDTMDTFVDSSWYFLRFLDPHNKNAPFDTTVVDAGMPVDVYIGGIEHAVLHLYFARFFQHFLHSEGLTSCLEPFSNLLLVGRIRAPAYKRMTDGKYLSPGQVDISVTPPVDTETKQPVKVLMEKMSKSKFNGVDPCVVFAENSVDVTRLAILQSDAPRTNRDWRTDIFEHPYRWLNLVWNTVGAFIHFQMKVTSSPALQDATTASVVAACEKLDTNRNKAIYKATQHYENFDFHSVIKGLESYVHIIRSVPKEAIVTEQYEIALRTLLVLLAPMVPHVTAEMWAAVNSYGKLSSRYQAGCVHDQLWPVPDPGYELPLTFSVNLNENKALSVQLTGEAAHQLRTADAIQWAQQHFPDFWSKLKERPLLSSSVETDEDGDYITLRLYTMTAQEIRHARRAAKQAKKLSLSSKAASIET